MIAETDRMASKLSAVPVDGAPRARRPKGKSQPAAAPAKAAARRDLSVYILPVMAGITTPLICLAMSTIVGALVQGIGTGLACLWANTLFALAMAVLVSMLAVSTPHVAEAMSYFGWEALARWAFAVALDSAIVVAELTHGHGSLEASIGWVPFAVVCGCTGFSAVLNSWVNLRYARIRL